MRRSLSKRFRRPAFEVLESRDLLSFGVTIGTAANGQSTYVIDNGADIKFSVIKGGSVSSTIHLGDISSIQYKGQELLASYAVTSRYSHYEQGLGSGAVISYTVDNANNWILVTCDDSAETSGAVIQYYAVRRNDDNIYMASLPIDVNNGPGEGRFLAYLNWSVFTNPEAPSDIAGNSGAIEGSDVYGFANGTTASKFYNMGREMIDNIYHGLTGAAGGISVGAWMFMGDRETSSGGPFFKDIDYQATGAAVEMYNCLFTGHTQTESFRQGLKGPYALQFTNGSLPVAPDYSWMEGLNLQGWIPAAQRGVLTGTASGVPSGHEVTVGLANSTAQYWATPDASGNYTITGIQPGTYTETLYDTELEVGQKTVTIAAGATTSANIVDTFYIPANPIFRIGTWDGTPAGFLNSDKISIMHPSDVRMSSWTATTNFVVGTNTDADWPLVQFMGVNNSQRITFNLTSNQVQALTLRIGITLAFAGGRNRVTVNAGQSYAWTSAIPTISIDLNSRGITRGTWRGDNQVYMYNIPASALRAGTNTIDLPVVSGSYVSGQTWLSPNVVYDAIDLIPTSSVSPPAIDSVTIVPANSAVGVNGTATFIAIAKDSSGNVIAANINWSAGYPLAGGGTIDPNGVYHAPATAGSDTITATATTTEISGYSSTSSSTTAISGTVSGTGSTAVNVVVNATPSGVVATSPTMAVGTSQQIYLADQSGAPLATNPPATWSASVGSITANGVYTAPASPAASVTITAQTASGTFKGYLAVSDPSAWYKADETSGSVLADATAGGHTATLTSSYNFVSGVSGNAVRLTGGYASLPAGIVSGVSNFTIAAWIKADSLNTWSRVFDFGTGTTDYMFLSPSAGGTNALRFAITTSGGSGEQQLNGPALTTGTWYHIAVVLAGNTGTLYVNGAAVATNTGITLHPTSLGSTTQNYLAKSQFSDPAFMGTIDDFRIYNRALSAAEILALVKPTVVTAAASSAAPVAATSTTLSVLGAHQTVGEAALTYAWATTGTPPAAVNFSVNGSNAAKSTIATFTKAGTYNFLVTISDPLGNSTTSSVSVTVQHTPQSASISPATANITAGGSQQFTLMGQDQFGQAFTITDPSVRWQLSGPGSLGSSSGLYMPPYAARSASVQAAYGGLTISPAAVTVTGQAQWNSTVAGTWGTWDGSGVWEDSISGSTIAAPGTRGILGDTVLFASATGATVSLNGKSPTLAGMTFNTAATGYTIAQSAGESITLQGDNGATVSVLAGSHSIAAPLHLASNTAFNASAGSSLAISGAIDGSGSVNVTGGGTLILSGSNGYTGGTVVSSGKLIITSATALPSGGSLTIGSAASFSNAAPAAPTTSLSATPATKALSPRAVAAVMAVRNITAAAARRGAVTAGPYQVGKRKMNIDGFWNSGNPYSPASLVRDSTSHAAW